MNKTDVNLIVENYLRNPFRSLGLSLLIALLASVLLVGGLLSLSLSKGLDRLSSRLGADVIVFPQGSEVDDQTILLQGDFKYAYLPQGSLEFIRGLDDVEVATPQYFLTSLSSSCCDQKVWIVGFDPSSDFVIQPWIREVFEDKLVKGTIVVGSEISVGEKKTVKFFDREYPVAAKLEPIGNGLDQAVFVDVATLADIRGAAKTKGVRFDSSSVGYSSILIKLRPDSDTERLSREIYAHFDGLQIFSRKDLFSGLEKPANVMQVVVWIVVAFFLVIAAAAIVISFSLSTRERKREYALLRILGSTRRRLKILVLGEALLVSAVGTYIGLLFSSVFFFTFKIWLGEHIDIPFIVPENAEIAAVYAVIILFVFTICVPTLNRICGWHIVFSVPLGYSVFYVLSGYYLMYCVKVRNKWPLICGIVLITGILIVFSCLEIFPEEWEQNDNLLVAAEAVLFFCVFKEITLHRDNSLIWKADRLCFAVYLIHPLFIQFCYRFLGITPLSAGKWYAPAALGFGLFFTACSFLGSILLHKIKPLHDYVL